MLAKFSGLNPKGPYTSLEKEKENFCVVLTYTINRAREIRKFHVAVVLRTAKKWTKKRDARTKLLFCQSKTIVFLLFAVAVVIPKFCYYGNVTSNFSSLLAHKEARMFFS